MASTASLLFNIQANADDAEASVKKFRSLMSKDLDDLTGEFEDWSNEVFGKITTVNGALMAGAAAAAALEVAAVAMIAEMSAKYDEFAETVDRTMRTTGQSAATVSILHFAADETRTSFDTLSNGLVRFEGNVTKGAEGSTQLLTAFGKLGVSQDDLKAGQQDLMPLLAKVMDGFKGTASATDRAALARELFSRSGTELLTFLSKGSDGLADFTKKAEELGLVLRDKDVTAFREMKAAEEALKAQHEALDVAVGKSTIGIVRFWDTAKAAMASATKDGGNQSFLTYLKNVALEYAKIDSEVEKMSAAIQNAPAPPDVGAQKPVKLKEDFEGVSALFDTLKEKIVSFSGDETKMAEEMSKYSDEAEKARVHIDRLQQEGKITAESAARESGLLQRVPWMLAQIWDEFRAKQADAAREVAQRAADDQAKALQALRDRLSAATESTQGSPGQKAALDRELSELRDSYAAKGQLTAEMEDMLYGIRVAGMAKIDAADAMDRAKATAADQAEAARKDQQFAQAMNRLEEHQLQIVAAHQTERQKLELEYEKDLLKYSEVEEAKVVNTLTSETQIAAIHNQFAATRAAITTQYGQQLQTLINSEGWQGVFGSKFGALLKNDEQLLQQWQQSTNQSLMLVKVTLADLKQMAKDSFEQFAQSMGQGAVNAFVQGKSIEQAMKQALEATLASIAAQAAVQAIYAAGWGFFDLATGNVAGAEAAFESAAIFGVVAGATALGAKALSGGAGAGGGAASGGSGGSGAGGGSSPGGGGGGAAAGSGAPGAGQQPYVQINVSGHVIGNDGMAQLATIMNDAIVNNNVSLYATHNRKGVSLS